MKLPPAELAQTLNQANKLLTAEVLHSKNPPKNLSMAKSANLEENSVNNDNRNLNLSPEDQNNLDNQGMFCKVLI